MYRIIGILLMIAGTIVLIILGSLVLIWGEIISIPKEELNEKTPGLIPSER